MIERFTVATWNINSIRLRMNLVCQFLSLYQPDVLCLQETKSPTELVDMTPLITMGYPHFLMRGQKSYNGVVIISRLPLTEVAQRNFINKDEARHIAGRLPNGITIENCYVPAGGDIPDREINTKFGDKLDFIAGMTDWSSRSLPQKTILLGDFNIAPLEDDVWSHKQLLKVVSHTPIEVKSLNDLLKAGEWVDIVRHHQPEGKLYSWWSYRARNWATSNRGRRLDHIWISQDILGIAKKAYILRDIRDWERPSDHVPVVTEFVF